MTLAAEWEGSSPAPQLTAGLLRVSRPHRLLASSCTVWHMDLELNVGPGATRLLWGFHICRQTLSLGFAPGWTCYKRLDVHKGEIRCLNKSRDLPLYFFWLNEFQCLPLRGREGQRMFVKRCSWEQWQKEPTHWASLRYHRFKQEKSPKLTYCTVFTQLSKSRLMRSEVTTRLTRNCWFPRLLNSVFNLGCPMKMKVMQCDKCTYGKSFICMKTD